MTIQKALDASINKVLPVKEFIQITGLTLPNILPFEVMWGAFQCDQPIYLSDDLIRAFGYKGPLSSQKQSLNKIIDKHTDVKVSRLTNEEYTKLLETTNCYPALTNAQLKSRPLHILIKPHDLKRIMMTVDTPNGNSIRTYYIDLEILFQQYLTYQCEFYKRCVKKEVSEIHNLPQNKEYNRQLRLQALDQEQRQRYRVGVVYFICVKDEPSIVKIGFTFNLPERLKQLQTAHYKELVVREYY
jgi:hypothetical protein